MAHIIVNNLLIDYATFPDKKADNEKCLLFLHGWRSNKEVWKEVERKLVSESVYKQYSLYALDFPGFGGSQVPPKALTVGDYANVVGEFIKKLDLKNVVLVGHSFGGRVGIKLASVHNPMVEKIVLVDSAGFAMDEAKKSAIGLAAKIARPFFKPRFMGPLREKIYQKIGSEDYLATPELRQTFINTVSEDLSVDMKKITIPTLIISGENDKDTPPSFGQKMRSLIPKSQFQILKNAGHFSFLDQPQDFIKMLQGFIL